MSSPDTYISKDKRFRDWYAERPTFVVGGDPEVWRSAAKDYFRSRLDDRYLNPIKTLQDHGSWRGEGFSIVAIQCTLVEFLESTVQGKNYRRIRRGDAPLAAGEYSKSSEIFVSFLCSREPFRTVFGTNRTLADDFYTNVRCALLHEACTKGGWLIQADGSAPDVVDVAKRVLYRDKFQSALLQFISWYEGELPTDALLQQGFLRKFDALAAT